MSIFFVGAVTPFQDKKEQTIHTPFFIFMAKDAIIFDYCIHCMAEWNMTVTLVDEYDDYAEAECEQCGFINPLTLSDWEEK